MKAKITDLLLGYAAEVPQVLFTIAFSFLSGHLWVFTYLEFITEVKNEKKILNNKYGKTCLGVIWFSIILVPVYMIKFQTMNFNHSNVLLVVTPTIIYSLVLQGIIFFIVSLKRRKK